MSEVNVNVNVVPLKEHLVSEGRGVDTLKSHERNALLFFKGLVTLIKSLEITVDGTIRGGVYVVDAGPLSCVRVQISYFLLREGTRPEDPQLDVLRNAVTSLAEAHGGQADDLGFYTDTGFSQYYADIEVDFRPLDQE